MEQSKSGGDPVLRTSTPVRDSPDRGEEQDILLGESDGSSSTPRQDSSPDDGEAKMISGPVQGTTFTGITLNRVKMYVPREASFPIPLRYIDVTRATRTTLHVMLEHCIDDSWKIEGNRDLSDSWTGVTRFTILDEKPSDECSWFGARLIRKQTTSSPNSVARDVERHVRKRRNEKGSTDTLSRNSSLSESMCCRWEPPCETVQGDLLRKVKNK